VRLFAGGSIESAWVMANASSSLLRLAAIEGGFERVADRGAQADAREEHV
jgi:hypothetical protein